MRLSRHSLILLALLLSMKGYANDCIVLDPSSDQYQSIANEMGGLFQQPFKRIQDCGVMGWSHLYEGFVDVYETYGDWARSGEVRCWHLNLNRPEERLSCSRKIVSRNERTGKKFSYEHHIPLDVMDELIDFLIKDTVADAMDINSIAYTPVECGGAWSMETFGYRVHIRTDQPNESSAFQVTKVCSPSPCVWQAKFLNTVRIGH